VKDTYKIAMSLHSKHILNKVYLISFSRASLQLS